MGILGEIKMDILDNKILICNCEKTMSIDGTELSTLCKSTSNCTVENNLCGSDINVVLEALNEAKNNDKNLLIACTQETKTFELLAEENNLPAPTTFNIREHAGWSKEEKK